MVELNLWIIAISDQTACVRNMNKGVMKPELLKILEHVDLAWDNLVMEFGSPGYSKLSGAHTSTPARRDDALRERWKTRVSVLKKELDKW